jgi:hypothetical protein
VRVRVFIQQQTVGPRLLEQFANCHPRPASGVAHLPSVSPTCMLGSCHPILRAPPPGSMTASGAVTAARTRAISAG